MNYIIRNNQIEHIWRFRTVKNGFEQMLFIRGTEDEAREYVEGEYGNYTWYSACTDKETEAIATLGAKVYLAPQK